MVICRQTADGTPDQQHRIAPHSPKQTDVALLKKKADSAAKHGWVVEWAADKRSFTATKERWGGVLCTRRFWIE